MTEPIVAATSLSPDIRKVNRQQACIGSWLQAELRVVSFNHPSEIAVLRQWYDIDFVPVEDTSVNVFGSHFVPISAMLDWAAEQPTPMMLINSDIQLRISPWELTRLRWLSEGGLCYIVRHNHQGDVRRTWQEPSGIDCFILGSRDAELFQSSFLSMGQPFWDYWIPFIFASSRRPVRAVEFPVAFHQCHPQQWSWQSWHRCAREFNRMTGVLQDDTSFEACQAMSRQVRETFERVKVNITSRPLGIREWVLETFGRPGAKVFLELGAHDGTDTAWMAEIPDVVIHAFEPDQRNHQPSRSNVVLHRCAVGDRDGHCPFVLSESGWGREWTYSSSIKQPKHHLSRYPVTFGDTIEVGVTTLDSFRREHGLGVIDFIWADIQGAEGEMIRGGRDTLAHTRFLYTEYSDHELYEDQVSLQGILEMIPDFRIVEIWPDDVLLENRRFTG